MSKRELKPEDVKYIVVHCSATPGTMNIGAKEIDRWHRQKGWLKIGYHFVIRRSGEVEQGRRLNEIGAHVQGYNQHAIGVCMVGGIDKDNQPENNFTEAQFVELSSLLRDLRRTFPYAEVLGHRDIPNVHKACPSFDVREWIEETNALLEEYP